ncbi:Hypothetical predicted protein [Mytilus galloprovincialis]|uniref:Uncharacterized protein n=1 Tax=Mytilus galloprovincialis TaxID=29158 RepID=A0A8B6C811_MYTGA|nr:Hypothetical predicted protein [Mytilus galloprovincialis]
MKEKKSSPRPGNMSSEPQSQPRETFMMKISDLELFLKFHSDTHNTVLNFQNITPENLIFKKQVQCEQIFSNKFRDALPKVTDEIKMKMSFIRLLRKSERK